VDELKCAALRTCSAPRTHKQFPNSGLGPGVKYWDFGGGSTGRGIGISGGGANIYCLDHLYIIAKVRFATRSICKPMVTPSPSPDPTALSAQRRFKSAEQVTSITVDSNGYLHTGSDDGVCRQWSTFNPKRPVREFSGHTGYVLSMLVAADGTMVTGGRDGTVCCHSVVSDRPSLFVTEDSLRQLGA
jgi:WD40 repeat protein